MLDVWLSLIPQSTPSCLDAAEQVRRDRFVFERDRETYARAHALKRLILSYYDPSLAPEQWRFETLPHGKPYIAPLRDDQDSNPGYQFNLSHSGSAVALAVAPFDIGVDIETPRPLARLENLAESVFHPEELRWLWRQPDTQASFYHLWTLKEALLKAAGTGLSLPPDQFACEGLDSGDEVTAWVDGRQWRCVSRCEESYTVSLAVPHEAPPPKIRYLCVESAPQTVCSLTSAHPLVNEVLQRVRVD